MYILVIPRSCMVHNSQHLAFLSQYLVESLLIQREKLFLYLLSNYIVFCDTGTHSLFHSFLIGAQNIHFDIHFVFRFLAL